MLQVCGKNDNNIIGGCPLESIVNSSNLNAPTKSYFSISEILSYSFNCCRSVLITRDGQILGTGDNNGGQISNSLPRTTINKFTNFLIKDKSNRTLVPISVVTTYKCTLYTVSYEGSEDDPKLAVSSDGIDSNSQPIILNIENRHPMALFGGHTHAAAITTDGELIFIYYPFSNFQPKIIVLPNNEKAVSVAICDSSVIILSSTGRLYESPAVESHSMNFSLVSDLSSIEIVSVSGYYCHFFAVSKEGRVYARGANDSGKLGLGQSISNASRFTEISSLNKYKIIEAYAGYQHSLFQTLDGGILACGDNSVGQCFLEKEKGSQFYSPVETLITSGTSFCIAGCSNSAAFINFDRPHNLPKKRINNDEEILNLKKEILRLQRENESLKRENERLKSNKNENRIELIEVEKFEKFKEKILIGRGIHSFVFRVSQKVFYAIRELEIISNENQEKLENFKKELDLINNINHPNIIKTHGFCNGNEKNHPAILLDYCPYNLLSVVVKLKPIERITVIFEVCSAMKEIHSIQFIHGNLKPENILIDENMHVKLSDVSFWKFEDIDPRMIGVSSLRFLAPEMMSDNKKFNNKIDVYSLGIVMFFILTEGKYPKVNIEQIQDNKDIEIPSNINKVSRDLISQCISKNQDERPTTNEIVDYIISNNFKLMDGIENEIDTIKKFLSI